MITNTRLSALATTVVLAACAADLPDTAGYTVRDSAGIQLVHGGAALYGDSLLPLEEDLRLGVLEEPEHLQFFRVLRIAEGEDGRLYVGNNGTNEVRVFEPDGRYVRTIGRQGSGPGEFRSLNVLTPAGDSLVVTDFRLGRATVFGPDGRVIETWPVRNESAVVAPGGRAGDSWLFLHQEYGGWHYEIGKALRREVRIVAGPSAEEALREGGAAVVAEYREGRRFGLDGGRAMTANSPPWEPDPDHAVDGAGRIHIAAGDSYRVDTYSPDGRLGRILTRDHAAIPITDDLLGRLAEKVTMFYDTSSQRHGEWDIARGSQVGRLSLPHAPSLPATGRILASRAGALWVERPDLVPDPVRLEWTREGEPQSTYWDVFDPDGRFIGTAALPPRFGIRAVTDRGVVGVMRDELDVEQVVRLRVAEARPQ